MRTWWRYDPNLEKQKKPSPISAILTKLRTVIVDGPLYIFKKKIGGSLGPFVR